MLILEYFIKKKKTGNLAQFQNYSFDQIVYLVPEIDGIRIISKDFCEFLQRVPDVTEDIFKIGATSPSAMLYDAMEHFENKSPKADDNIRNIKSDLSNQKLTSFFEIETKNLETLKKINKWNKYHNIKYHKINITI